MKYLADLALVVTLALVAMNPNFVTVAALFVAMLGYIHKSYEENKKKVIEEKIEKYAEAQDAHNIAFELQIKQILQDMEDFKKVQVQVERSAEDIKKVISTANLGNALYTRIRKKEMRES